MTEKISSLFFNYLEIPKNEKPNYRKNLHFCTGCKKLAPYYILIDQKHPCKKNGKINGIEIPVFRVEKFQKLYKNPFFYGTNDEGPFRDLNQTLEFKIKLKELVNEENFFTDEGKDNLLLQCRNLFNAFVLKKNA